MSFCPAGLRAALPPESSEKKQEDVMEREMMDEASNIDTAKDKNPNEEQPRKMTTFKGATHRFTEDIYQTDDNGREITTVRYEYHLNGVENNRIVSHTYIPGSVRKEIREKILVVPRGIECEVISYRKKGSMAVVRFVNQTNSRFMRGVVPKEKLGIIGHISGLDIVDRKTGETIEHIDTTGTIETRTK